MVLENTPLHPTARLRSDPMEFVSVFGLELQLPWNRPRCRWPDVDSEIPAPKRWLPSIPCCSRQSILLFCYQIAVSGPIDSFAMTQALRADHLWRWSPHCLDSIRTPAGFGSTPSPLCDSARVLRLEIPDPHLEDSNLPHLSALKQPTHLIRTPSGGLNHGCLGENYVSLSFASLDEPLRSSCWSDPVACRRLATRHTSTH